MFYLSTQASSEVLNQKDGVDKTTITINLVAAHAKRANCPNFYSGPNRSLWTGAPGCELAGHLFPSLSLFP